MWIAVVAVGVVVLGLAAYAANGGLGAMPDEVVTDSARSLIPEGPVDAEFLARVRFASRLNGYDPAQVDAYLRSFVDGTAGPAVDATFELTRGGYNMADVDEVLDRVTAQQDAAPDPFEPSRTPVDEQVSFAAPEDARNAGGGLDA